MDLLQAVVLGAVQGLTEFLPISSSGHLILVPWLFDWQDPGLVFDVALHAGTLVALVAYYWRTWIDLLLHDQRLLVLIIAGSIPAGLIGLVGEKISEEHFRQPWQIGIGLVLFGLLLYWTDRSGAKVREGKDMTLPSILLIGGAQGLAAIFPGISRSGITITTALALGFKRETAANVSFLLATPITAGALLWAARHLVGGGEPGIGAPAFVAGILTSGVVGFLAIHYLLRYVRTRSYAPFVIYRLVIGALVVLLALLRG
ncbi:MAG TPA: undecaprenyl-diphosphate phosphatase [Chloroflexota bacterium]|nr:undecaprenyl-diphosphate phosphatase [Chloroflexota bacterium]